ncbi:alpha-tubulin N-acetyltransferase [Leptothoe sp. ISB3NOV94-8A]|uniref:Uncharacterized protein n=1 Tax=Adonisia turfae CCMR0081 TaxID=2292702 RepID=A0A6M0RN19_9CYAN|nr:alpha-tubulin N-acetyltransferase [Adonisia turfae]NEZ57675.1 hypothetical protein [Adonisia turfae CCMR0081]
MTAPSLRLLLSTLIDYAGLLSSTSLGMAAAITAYERYSDSSHRWMLGRFVLCLSQLSQFENCLDELEQQYAAAFWPLSVILEPSAQALENLAPWLKKQNRFTISALEFKLAGADAIAPLLPHLPPHSDLFFEVPLDATLPDYLAVLQGSRAAIKVRMGGPTAADCPSIDTLAHLLVTCANGQIPLKATGGLHQPLRSWQLLPDGNSVEVHGFLNIALAAAFAYGYGATASDITTILQINTLDDLIFSAQEIICHSPLWSPEPELSNVAGHLPLEILANVRSRYFLGINANSFQEPLANLYRLGLLGNALGVPSYAFSS